MSTIEVPDFLFADIERRSCGSAIEILKQVEGAPLTIRQLAALQATAEAGSAGIHICREAARLDMHPSTMHRCMDFLLEAGLVKHERSLCDRRQVYYLVTPKGAELAQRLGWMAKL